MLGIPMTALHKTYNGDLGKMKADFAKKFAGATLEIKVRTQTAGCWLLAAGGWLLAAPWTTAQLLVIGYCALLQLAVQPFANCMLLAAHYLESTKML